MTNIYQQLSQHLCSQQDIPLATEREEAPVVTEQKKESSVTRQKKQIEKVSSQPQPGVSDQKEQIKNVLKSWSDNINSSSKTKKLEPQNTLFISQKKALEDNYAAIKGAVDKLMETDDKLSELNRQNNKYSFVEALENMVGEILTEEGKKISRSPINHQLIVFYNKQRQQLLHDVAAIYPDHKIGRIWA